VGKGALFARAHAFRSAYLCRVTDVPFLKAANSSSPSRSPTGRVTCWFRHIDRLRRIYADVQRRRPFETVAICVLPDHIHAIWRLPPNDADFPLRWSLIKTGFSRGLAIDLPRTPSKIAKRERGLWQRRYWEHAIRDDADLERHIDYIHFNPVKHGLVSRVCDWPHSSFKQYVERGDLPLDWGGDVTNPAAGEYGE
jgi:putative transposase